jgi:putative inorganic carbon (hco3(-)) transporter
MKLERREPIAKRAHSRCAVGFGLFLLVNAALFLRPAEIIPELQGAPIFEALILGCLAVSLPAVLNELKSRRLAAAPITCCVLGLLAAVALSHLSQMRLRDAFESSFTFFKIVVYYLLLVGLVNSPARLKWFLLSLLGCIAIVSTLALLEHHGVIDNPSLVTARESSIDVTTGEPTTIERIGAAGIFGNPNDLARILVIGLALAVYLVVQSRSPLTLVPVAAVLVVLFGYTLSLTHSRGGFIDLAVTTLVLVIGMFRGRKALVLSVIAVLVMFVVFAGRQTDLTVADGTGQQRIRLWSEGLEAFRTAPLFGIGMGEYSSIGGGLSAHNAFVQAFVELGLLGGTLLLGAYYLAVRYTSGLRVQPVSPAATHLRRAGPFILAITTGYAAGLLSSSRVYVMPTYMILGLACVHQRLSSPFVQQVSRRLDTRLVRDLICLAVCSLIAIYLFVRLTARWQ